MSQRALLLLAFAVALLLLPEPFATAKYQPPFCLKPIYPKIRNDTEFSQLFTKLLNFQRNLLQSSKSFAGMSALAYDPGLIPILRDKCLTFHSSLGYYKMRPSCYSKIDFQTNVFETYLDAFKEAVESLTEDFKLDTQRLMVRWRCMQPHKKWIACMNSYPFDILLPFGVQMYCYCVPEGSANVPKGRGCASCPNQTCMKSMISPCGEYTGKIYLCDPSEERIVSEAAERAERVVLVLVIMVLLQLEAMVV